MLPTKYLIFKAVRLLLTQRHAKPFDKPAGQCVTTSDAFSKQRQQNYLVRFMHRVGSVVEKIMKVLFS